MLEDLKKASGRTVGMKETLKAVQRGTARLVYLAKDVDEYIARKIKDTCQSHDVEIIMVDSMSELGEACGITVGAATAAILKDQ
ncbi:MAG: ribosomal L7Ae/L30e/S12e/Gadd45 family protein [Caldicoprobacterales bacterium]|nr:50S ribosomal protein L7Ae-like protein [Clostridiales bacterium]